MASTLYCTKPGAFYHGKPISCLKNTLKQGVFGVGDISLSQPHDRDSFHLGSERSWAFRSVLWELVALFWGVFKDNRTETQNPCWGVQIPKGKHVQKKSESTRFGRNQTLGLGGAREPHGPSCSPCEALGPNHPCESSMAVQKCPQPPNTTACLFKYHVNPLLQKGSVHGNPSVETLAPLSPLKLLQSQIEER